MALLWHALFEGVGGVILGKNELLAEEDWM
jgi:hypothetical protein